MTGESHIPQKKDKLPRKVTIRVKGANPSAKTVAADPPFRELIATTMERVAREREEKAKLAIKRHPPNVFTQGMFQLRAGQLRLTPRQLFRYATMREEIGNTPEDVGNWFGKIAGDFSKPPLAICWKKFTCAC